MNQAGLVYVKWGIAGIFEIGVFVLAVIGKVTPDQAITAASVGIGALLVALGISGGGSAVASALSSKADPDRTTPPRGFSVVRLLGVLAIVGVLAALAFRPVPSSRTSSSSSSSSSSFATAHVSSSFAMMSSQGCGLFKSAAPNVPSDIQAVTQCVIGQLLAATVSVDIILQSCIGATLQLIADVAQELVDYFTTPADAGAVGAPGAVCGAGPKAGAPMCISSAQLSVIRQVQAEASKRLAAGRH